MNLYNISKELVLNADETPICLEPNINYSYDIKGKRDSPTVINFNLDKERISFLLTITSEGKHLKPYVVVKGKVVKRLVNDEVLKRCVVKANPKAWLTNELTKSYIEEVVLPYTKGRWAILLWDHFKCHYSQEIVEMCLNNHIIIILIPARCTPVLQPLDISVNKSLKSYLRSSSERFKIDQIRCGDIDQEISVVAPNRSYIILEVCNFTEKDISGINGFRKIGFYNESKELSNEIKYSGIFLCVKDYKLERIKAKVKKVNIGVAIRMVCEDPVTVMILRNYFNRNFSN